MNIIRAITFFVGLICSLQSLAQGQEIKNRYSEISNARLTEEQKIDSLYHFYNANFFKDYETVDSLALLTLNNAKRIKYTRGEAVIQLVLALTNEGMGKLVEMEKYAKEAVKILEKNRIQKDLARSYLILGVYYRRKNLKADALNLYLKGLKLTENLKDSVNMRLAFTYIAILNVSEKNYDKALEYHLKALDIAKRSKDVTSEQKCYTNIGIVYSRKKDYAQSLKYHQQALRLAMDLNDPRTTAFVYNDLGSTYLYLGDYPRSIAYLQKSIFIRENAREFNELSYTYNYLGQAFAKSNKYSQAEKALKKSYAIAEHNGNNKQIYEAFEELSKMYATFKNYDSAYVYSYKYTLFRDSIRQIENIENLNQLSAQFETEKKEQQIKELSQENTIQELELKQRKFLLIISVVLIVFVLLVAYLIYYKRRQKEKRLELEAQLLKIEAEQKINSERVRISRDLHDNIGSYLTFINTSMASVDSNDSVQRDKLDKIKDLTLETIQELRKTVWLINKTDVTLEEFSVKLRELFKNIGFLKVANVSDQDVKISAPQATEVFRVVQESVNNALKHSNATEIKIILDVIEESKLSLCIEDNGRGFDLEKVKRGYGLYNMNERVQSINGELNVFSEEGKGTKVLITIPLF